MQGSILTQLKATKQACAGLQDLSEAQIKAVLTDLAAALRARTPEILAANAKDLARMDPASPLYDRLLLDAGRIDAIAADVENVATLPSPVGQVVETRRLENGIDLSRVRVPLGVIGMIYEARPNVTVDVFSLCFRSQNGCVLRGGTDAQDSNVVLVGLIRDVLKRHDVNPDVVYLFPPEREFVPLMLTARGLVDVIIPRGSQGLIDFVIEHASVPVIETGRGMVHTYVDENADIALAARVVDNAKTRRVSVCNALDTLLVHEALAGDLDVLTRPLAEKGVKLYANAAAKVALEKFYPAELLAEASAETYSTEFLSLQMNLALVSSFNAALDHIALYDSGHTAAVIAQDQTVIDRFFRKVDASTLLSNASTAFTDGGQFGLGAEIGISTQKLHARGPMALEALTSVKWLLRGAGQVRPV